MTSRNKDELVPDASGGVVATAAGSEPTDHLQQIRSHTSLQVSRSRSKTSKVSVVPQESRKSSKVSTISKVVRAQRRSRLLSSSSMMRGTISSNVHDPEWRQNRKSLLQEIMGPMVHRQSVFDFPHSNTPICIPDTESLLDIEIEKVPWWTSQRVLLSVICFLGFNMLYAQRVNISIAIVAMVIDDDDLHVGNDSVTTETPTTTAAAHASCQKLPVSSKETGQLRWDKATQGMVLGSFYWGYTLTQVPGGWIGEHFGARRVLICGMLPLACLTLLGPVLARAGASLFIASRVLMGLGSGVVYPAVQALWAHWAPPSERARLIGFAFAGGQFGNAVTFPITGVLIAHLGWHSAFYVSGSFGLVWVLIWFVVAADKPDESRFISRIEKRYIKSAIGERVKNIGGKTPWRYMLTSKAVWAIILAHAFGNYGTYMLLSMLPLYMKEVLYMDVKSNGLYSSLPFVVFWLFINVAAVIADKLISKDILSIVATRKLMSVLGLAFPGLAMFFMGFLTCDNVAGAVALMSVCLGFSGFRYSGFFINHGDIAPPFAGTLFGLSNMAGSISGFVAPAVTRAVTYSKTREQWQKAFFLGAGCSIAGAMFYVLLGEGEIQWWAAGTDESLDDEIAIEAAGDNEGELTKSNELQPPGKHGQGEVATADTRFNIP